MRTSSKLRHDMKSIERDISKVVVNSTTKNYDSHELNAINSIKINNFASLASFLFKIQKAMKKIKEKRLKNLFNIYHAHEVNSLAIEDIRAKRLQNFNFMKKIASKRPLGKKRAFLKWKVMSDIDLQETCIKRFAVCARINYAIAVYRMKWIVDRNRIMNKYIDGDYYLKAIIEFIAKAERIKRETYSNRNQLEWAFKQIKARYEWKMKLEEFDARYDDIMGQSFKVRQAFGLIKKVSEAKKLLATKLRDKLLEKEKRAYMRLLRNSAEEMRREGNFL